MWPKAEAWEWDRDPMEWDWGGGQLAGSKQRRGGSARPSPQGPSKVKADSQRAGREGDSQLARSGSPPPAPPWGFLAHTMGALQAGKAE